MPTRRTVLGGLGAASLAPQASWADLGAPAFLAAAREPSGTFTLVGLDASGYKVFARQLPARGHAAAIHPTRDIAVAIARRPGSFGIVLSCGSGQQIARIDAPEGHHFSGHGAFSADGRLLFTAENDFENARGMIGLWDCHDGYRRIGSFQSGGIGPHEIRLMPDGKTLVVANGGIETHPDSGRAKLNIPDMRPNLSYLSFDGALLDQREPPREWHKNSIRHIAIRGDGTVALACQWQGDSAETPPLLATHRFGEDLRWHESGHERVMQGYAGSIAFNGPGDEIAITGPRGDRALVFSSEGQLLWPLHATDICGVASAPNGFAFTTGEGVVVLSADGLSVKHSRNWDNHMMSLG